MEPNGRPGAAGLGGPSRGAPGLDADSGHAQAVVEQFEQGGQGDRASQRGRTDGSLESMAYETGTTTVGLVASDGVVLATDRRASLGGRFVSNKDVVKVEQVHPTGAVTIAGSVGAAQAYLRQLRAAADLYETRRGERMSMDALSTAASNSIRGLPVQPLLGGVDPAGADGEPAPRLFQLDGGGGLLEESAFAATGSGMTMATGALERGYEPDATVEAAVGTAVEAVLAASERDTASGNGVVVARVTADGVATERRDGTGALMNGANGGTQ